MRALLQGRFLSHPLHPALVHLPLAAFALGLLLDIAALRAGAPPAVAEAASYALAFGVAAALVAAVPGFVDRADIRVDHPARRIATVHMALNAAALVLYVASLAVRYFAGEPGRVSTPGFALAAAGFAVLAVSGYLGGALVYRHGIGVGRHRRRGRTPRETVVVDASRARGGFVFVGRTRGIADGDLLRIDVDGVAIAVVRSGRDFYAFQDFCTHRYGPLSEGCIVDGQVQCPWHGSRFDVRTGRVTRGPAKVDLRTYAVEQREGMLFLKLDRSGDPTAG